MKAAEIEACLRAQAQTIESLLSQLANSDTAPLASALQAALQREDTLKRQCSELLESMHDNIDEDKRMSNLAQTLDSQNHGLLAENAKLKEELSVFQEQVGVLRRSVSPLRRLKSTPKKQAILEHVEESLATKDYFTAGNKWRDADYIMLDADTPEKNFESLREILKLRDKQLATVERDLRTRTKEPTIAIDKLIGEVKEREAEIDLLKNSILRGSTSVNASPEVKTLKDKVQALQTGIDSRERDIRELLGEYETIRKELQAANEKLSWQDQEMAVLKDLPQDYRLEDLVREAEEAKGLLRHKEEETSRLLADLVDAQNERDNLRFKLVQAQSSQEEASNRRVSFEKDAQILRLQTELKLLKSRSPYVDLKERLRRTLQRADFSPSEIDLELKEILSAVDHELSNRVSSELASFTGSFQSQSGSRATSAGLLGDSKSSSMERLNPKAQKPDLDHSKAEVSRIRTLYDEEHKAHQKCLKLLRDAHPSIAEYEAMREDYFRGLQANLNRIIEQLTHRVETLVNDIRSKNEELLKQEARYEADLKSTTDKLKIERSKYKELGDRLTQEIARHKETKHRLDSIEDKGVFSSSEEAKRLLTSLRESETNLMSLHDRVQELQLNLAEKTRRAELLEGEVANYKDKAERLRLSEQALYDELVSSGKHQAEGTKTKQGLDLARAELQKLNQESQAQKNTIAQLKDEISQVKEELSDLNTELEEKTTELRALKKENSALKDGQRGEVKELKLKLKALQQQSYEETDDSRRIKDERTTLERELAQARRSVDQITDEVRSLKTEAARLASEKQKAEAALETARLDHDSKLKQQTDSLKTLKLEVARLKRIEERSDEASSASQSFKQEIETLRNEKARLKHKLDSLEDSRKEFFGVPARDQEDTRSQIDQLKRSVSPRQLLSKDKEIRELQGALESIHSNDPIVLQEKEMLISRLTDQVAQLTQELNDEKDEKRGLSLRVSQLMSGAEAGNPDSYKGMWQREKERAADLAKEARKLKDLSEDYRGLLENLVDCVEQTQAEPLGPDADSSTDLSARVFFCKEVIAALASDAKAQRPASRLSDSTHDRRADDAIRRLDQAASKVEVQLSSTDSIQHSTVLALLSEKVAAEKDLYEKSRALLEIELFVKYPDEGFNKWALQKWQEAEREVCKLRGQLLESAKKMELLWRKYDPGNEVIELRKQLERSTSQLQSLQKAVNWLQSERQKVSSVPHETLKSGADAGILRTHLKVITEEAEALKAQLIGKEREVDVLKRTAADSLRLPVDRLRAQASMIADDLGIDFLSEPSDASSTLHSLAALLKNLAGLYKSEKETSKALKAELDHERQGQRLHTDTLQVSVDSLRKEKLSVEHHVKELAAQVKTMSRELEMARDGLFRSSQDDLVKSSFERGRLVGVGEGRQQERKELETESKRMQELVREYRQSREELRRTQERLLLKHKT